MSFDRRLCVLMLCACATLPACASTLSKPVESDAALGRVVIYRNGVAYFERRAQIDDDRFTLDVPAERLDDFLKSLSVVDARSGKALPISFPTMDRSGGSTRVVVELPGKDHYDLRISYVTESPAWKPTYRVRIGSKGSAALESWAVVDNVSGEDWNHVAVGVGSTSALSFKYDLQSVRYVERETLSDGSELGVAPPTGGSPYAVASGEVHVLGQLGPGAVDDLSSAPPEPQVEAMMDAPAADAAEGASAKPATARPVSKAPPPSAAQGLSNLAARLRDSKTRIRILGFAQSNEQDKKGKSLERANAVKDALIKRGVAQSQLEVVATGRVAPDGVRLVAAEDDAKPAQATPDAASSDAPLGSAYFLAPVPLSIERGHSAMVSLLDIAAKADSVYYYDPISPRGSKRFAFRAVLLENPTHHTLDAGPVTVYSDGQFLGEGLSEAIPADSRAFIPFALDRKLLVETHEDSAERIDRLVTIERGVVQSEARRLYTTKLTLVNRDSKPITVYVRQPVRPGFKLESPRSELSKLDGAYLFRVQVGADQSSEFAIEESTPIEKRIDIRSEAGIAEIGLFLHSASALDPELSHKLERVVQTHRELAALGERIQTLSAQNEVYRERIGEINDQLVSLRRVSQAGELSRHLAKKMEEISNRLQHATMALADLQGKVLTARVTLEDQLSDLSLEGNKSVAQNAPALRKR